MALKDLFDTSKLINAAQEGFGEGPVGLSQDNKDAVRKYTGILSPVVESAATAGDVAMRGAGALWATGANAVGQFADSPALERDINLAGLLGSKDDEVK